MARDIVNFNAGPAGLPTAVLERAQAELMDFQGTGMSIMEHSHRGKAYDAVHNEAMSLTRSLMGVPDSYDVLFLQGGASGMFATIPMNFLTPGKVADYVITGTWSQKALEEAREQQFRMRMAAVTESVENTRQIRELRKRVARINTVLRERTLQAAAPAAKES